MLSDDGRFALIEIVARDRETLLPILSDPSVRAFEKGSAQAAILRHEIEAAFEPHKKGFTMTQFDEVNV